MLRKTAQIFSLLFHPLLMPTVGIAIMLFTESYLSYIPFDAKKWLIILSASGTFLIPVAIITGIYLQGRISGFQLDDRRERVFPLLITAALFLLTYILFKKIPVFKFLHAYMLGCFIAVTIASVINIAWKISTHMIGLGGITGMVLIASFHLNINLFVSLIGIFIASGIIGSSRVYLGAHSLNQVYAGYCTGLIVMMTTLLLY